MTITVNGNSARVVFSQAAVATTQNRGHHASVDLDVNGNVVAATFVGKAGARRIKQMLTRQYEVQLSEQDIASILGTFPS